MYLDRKFGLTLSLSEITLLFDLSLDIDRTLAQQKAKSKVKVTWCVKLVEEKRIDWLIEQGLTSPPTQYRLYGRRFFTGHKTQPTVSKYWRHT